MEVWDIVVKYRSALFSGLMVTLYISCWVWGIGIVLGTTLGSLSYRYPMRFGGTLRGLSAIPMAIPVIILLFWLHYPLQEAFEIVVDPVITTIVAIGLVNTLGVAEIVRSGLDEFPRQYLVAARVCGLRRLTRVRRVLLPLVVRQLLPGILLLQVAMLQGTIFGSLISVDELFRVAQRINAEVYRPIPVYTGLAVFFVAICLPLNVLGAYLRRRFSYLTSDR